MYNHILDQNIHRMHLMHIICILINKQDRYAIHVISYKAKKH